jgi:hypothetical protein
VCEKLMAMPSRDGQSARYFPLDLTRPYEDVRYDEHSWR